MENPNASIPSPESTQQGNLSRKIDLNDIPPPPPPLPVISSKNNTQTNSDNKSTPKKKKPVSLPPPPQELNLDDFDSKFRNSSKKKHSSVSSPVLASVDIPPPPPPLPVRKATATVVSVPPLQPSSNITNNNAAAPIPTVATIPPKPNPQPKPKPVVIGAGTPHPSNYFEPPKPTPSKTKTNLPPLSHLAPRQSSLPVLLVPTATSKALAQKNNLTLASLFQSLSHTIAPPNNLPSNHIAPRLPPFRSIGKSIVMHWNQIQLRFLDSDLLNLTDPNATDMELTRVCAEKYPETTGVASVETLEGMLKDVFLKDPPEKSEDGFLGEEEKKELEKETGTYYHVEPSTPSQPWLRSVRSILDMCTDNLQQDLHSCPVVALLVASTNDEFYLECLKELRSVHHLPRPHHSGHYDPHSMRFFYLLIHDNTSGPSDFDEGVALIQMRQAFPNQICAVLRMNSLSVDVTAYPSSSTLIQNPVLDALFQPKEHIFPHRNGILNKDLPCGQSLSDNDIANIQRFIATLVSDCIIPAMERRIFNLNVAVNNAKRGVKNVFKSFWRKPKDGSNTGNTFDNFSSSFHGMSKSSTNQPNNAMVGTGNIKYTYDQIESQIRLLADSLFLMRDYESALSIYRLAKDDYKSDRATVHYASVYEMMALCLYSFDPLGTRNNHRDLHSAVETALYSYTRGAEEERFLHSQSHSQSSPSMTSLATQSKQGFCNKLATRLCLVICSIKPLHQNRHMETADLLTSASSHETPLCAAILLEQSARHYKAANMHKKYAFHMLMAGHMFRTAKVEQHSMRCFSLSHKMYNDSRWMPLSIHLESALSQQLYHLKRYEVAMMFYCKLVGYEGIGRNHQKFLQNLLDIFRQNPDEAFKAAETMRSRMTHVIEGEDPSSRKHPSPLREIPGMELPRVMDENIRVLLEHQMESKQHSGIEVGDGEEKNNEKVIPGSDSLWQIMSCNLEAELRVVNSTSGDKNVTRDEMITKVLEEIDEEKYKIESTQKKNAKNPTNLPAKRHRSEPIVVQTQVSNPMDIQLYLTDVQLVASFRDSENGFMCTNEYTPDTDGENKEEKKRYNFRSSLRNFETPDFVLHKGDHPESKENESSFVVEKQSFVLDPNETKHVSLGVCPLKEGSLVIRGMRWKLFNDLWIYHEFKTQGPLLQDTPEHRSNRVRGEPQLLKSEISHDMPTLVLDIVKAKTSVLQGEIHKWKVRLTNIGSAPTTNIVMKTNVPWTSIDASDGEGELNEDSARSHCIGPSGTSMSLPISKIETEISSVQNDVIYPGETAEVDINVCAFGGGRHDLYMLVRYELHEEGEGKQSSRKPFRYVKKVISIAVYPSLNLSASLMPSYWEKDEHILSVEMTNYRSDQQSRVELFLHYLAIASRYYRAVPIEGQICEESESMSKMSSAVSIDCQERLTMHYRIIPLEDTKFFTSKSPFLLESDISENDDKTNLDFLCLENAFTKFRVAQKKHDEERRRRELEGEEQDQPRSIQTIRRDNMEKNTNEDKDQNESNSNTPSKPFHPTSLASMCPVGDEFSSISLLCGWSAHIGTGENISLTNGQHHLSQLVVRPTKKKKGCPLTITSKHKSNLKHDFSRGLLRTDLEITVRNRLIKTPVEFEFSLERRPEFNIIGAESFKWKLEGGEDLTVPVQVEILSSGVYNLQTVRLVVLSKDSTIPYVFPLQWILRVNE